jgi:predicted phage-related endonuclease
MFDIGKALEPVLHKLYERKSGRLIENVRAMRQHGQITWAYASLDRQSRRRTEHRIVELKWAPHRRWSEGTETVPASVQDQVQWQMFVMGYEVTDVAVLEGSRFTIHEVGRDDAYIDDLTYIATDYRQRVLMKQLPEHIDGSADNHRTLSRLFRKADGDPILLFDRDPVWDDLARRWRSTAVVQREAKSELSAVKAAVKALVGDAAGVLSEPLSYRFDWKRIRSIDWQAIAMELDAPADLVAMHTRTDWKAVAETLRPRPKLIDKHASLSETRRLTASFKGMPADEPDEQEDAS